MDGRDFRVEVEQCVTEGDGERERERGLVVVIDVGLGAERRVVGFAVLLMSLISGRVGIEVEELELADEIFDTEVTELETEVIGCGEKNDAEDSV